MRIGRGFTIGRQSLQLARFQLNLRCPPHFDNKIELHTTWNELERHKVLGGRVLLQVDGLGRVYHNLECDLVLLADPEAVLVLGVRIHYLVP